MQSAKIAGSPPALIALRKLKPANFAALAISSLHMELASTAILNLSINATNAQVRTTETLSSARNAMKDTDLRKENASAARIQSTVPSAAKIDVASVNQVTE